MFCVECGKELPIFKDGSCINCYLKNHSFSKGPEIIDLPVCTHCNSYKYKSNWTSNLFGEVLIRLVKNHFTISREFKKIDINSKCSEEREGMNCKIIISGFVNDVEINEEHDLFVRFKKTVCDVCSKQFGGYHEAIIQIRADNRKIEKDELKNIRLSVESLVEDMKAKGNRSLFITDVAEEHGGLDFYISDKGSGLVIAKKLQGTYGGIIKQSSKNIGMKDSRQIYRMTYLLRLPSLKKGEFISYKNSFYFVTSISGSKFHLIELSSWTKQIFDEKDIQKAKLMGGDELIKEMILVSQTEDEAQIMNPDNYEITIVKKPKSIKIKSEKVRVVKLEDQYFFQSITDK